jgi:hypothetical protein
MEMKLVWNVRHMCVGLSIGAAVLIGISAGPQTVPSERTLCLSGFGPEDFCEYSQNDEYCPQQSILGGCTDLYSVFGDQYDGYLTVLDYFLWADADYWQCNDGPAGPCDDDYGTDYPDIEECQETC